MDRRCRIFRHKYGPRYFDPKIECDVKKCEVCGLKQILTLPALW